ncbi:MAG: Rrf2 family transcriptional regulator [Coriobacteriia bacterium]|nr:Rrf2 family transcriptional regulator [Coriobacteriia bacterium]
MQVSTKGRYALRLMVDLGSADKDAFTPLREISERQKISEKYLEQIIRPLAKAGYVRSARGIFGGYQLAKDSQAITVGEVLRAVEGELAPIPCSSRIGDNCENTTTCVTRDVWQSINDSVNEVVDNITLEELVSRSNNTRGACPSKLI